MVALIPHGRFYRRVGVRLLRHLLQQPTGDKVRHLRAVLRVHGTALPWSVFPNRVHRLLLVPVVHTEDLRVHQGGHFIFM